MKEKIIRLSGKQFFTENALPLSVVPAGDGIPGSDYTFLPHKHDFEEIVFIVSGTGVQVINDTPFNVQAGDVFVICGEYRHHFSKSQDLFLYNILLDPARIPLPLGLLRKIYAYRFIFETEPQSRTKKTFQSHLHLNYAAAIRAENMVRNLAGVLKKTEDPARDAAGLSRLLELIVFFCSEYHHGEHPDSPLPGITKILTWLETHYAERITLNTMARDAHTSARTFLRQFRSITGLSPVAYLLQLRLGKAAELLTNSALNIGTIAEKTGFADSNYFSRKFSERYHISPRMYRKNFTSQPNRNVQ